MNLLLLDDVSKISNIDDIPTTLSSYIIDFFYNKKIKDILLYLPTKVIERKKCLSGSKKGDIVSIMVTVLKHSVHLSRGKKKYIKVICCSGISRISLVFFNSSIFYIKKILSLGHRYYVSGVLSSHNIIIHPEKIEAYSQKDDSIKLITYYDLNQSISNNDFLRVINIILKHIERFECFENELIDSKKWFCWLENIRNIHFPRTIHDYNKAVDRLKYEEIFSYFLKLKFLKMNNESLMGNTTSGNGTLITKFIQRIGFKLTPDQEYSCKEIFRDQLSTNRMVRILQGDVGSGKTLVAILAILNCIESGKQCCFIAPTSVLSVQHFNFINDNLGDIINIKILLGGYKNVVKRNTINDIKNNNINLIIGTHALLQEYVQFYDLGLIVIDEQHKFGVNQRYKIIDKNTKSDVLMLSATPIPRSLSQVFYGDIDCSFIRTKPIGRKEIKTTLMSSEKINDVVERLKIVLNKNNKLYWICPSIENNDESSIISILERYDFLNNIFPDKVVFLHGKMSDKEKEYIIMKFKENDNILILVSTTVIETGIDIKSANFIIIDNAERYGLSQLHQLRGRVGRGQEQSYCILLYNKNITSNNSLQRLNFIKQSVDGFEIAEKDLKFRGGGNIFGNEQSGLPKFRFYNYEDENYFNFLKDVSLYVNKIYNSSNLINFKKIMLIYEKENEEIIIKI